MLLPKIPEQGLSKLPKRVVCTIADENGKVTLTVKWGTDGASVANNGGSLLLIPVSAECTEADVAFAFEYRLGDNR